jgi:archaemetzincin
LSSLPKIDSSPRLLSSLWLSRMCRTASHELGHCFGIDHCVYYACIMQGSASLSEDTRQPPYLCPVDCAKLLHATGSTARERYLALLEYCNRATNHETHFFSAFAAWLTAVCSRYRYNTALSSAESIARTNPQRAVE